MKRGRKRRNLRTTFLIKGRMVEVVTCLGLAKILDKSKSTILRYEKTGVFPPAPIMYQRYRYYPVDFAKDLALIVRKFPKHIAIPQDLIVEVNKLFKEEKEKYA